MQIDLSRAQNIHANDPGAIQQMIDALTEDLLADISAVLLDSGNNLWRLLGAVVVVWTGLRIAFSGGGFSGWDLVRLLMALAIPRTLLHFYSVPMPIGGQTLPEAIVGMGAFIADLVAQDTWSSAWTWGGDFLTRAWNEIIASAGIGSRFWLLDVLADVGNAVAAVVLAVLALFMAFVSLLFLAIGFTQVIWSQFAISVVVVFGPIFIPFLLIEPLAFLFWGWLRSLLTYSMYSAVAACVLRVFFAAVMAASDGIWENLVPDLDALGAALMWVVSYIALAIAGILAALKIPELASSLVSGNVGGGGMLGALAAVATAGRAAVAVRGAAALRGAK